jgi:hypothetical protein
LRQNSAQLDTMGMCQVQRAERSKPDHASGAGLTGRNDPTGHGQGSTKSGFPGRVASKVQNGVGVGNAAYPDAPLVLGEGVGPACCWSDPLRSPLSITDPGGSHAPNGRLAARDVTRDAHGV